MACHSIQSTRLASRFSDGYESDDDEDESNEKENKENENESDEEYFTSGATIYTKLNALNGPSDVANGYSIRLLLENTNQIVNYRKGEGSGNVNATFDTGIVNSFTAQVLDTRGNVVNSSFENSHDITRLACNTCHNTNGANNAPGRIVSFKYSMASESAQTTLVDTNNSVVIDETYSIVSPAVTVSKYFSTDVMPILESNCKSCHGSNGSFEVTSASTTFNNIQSFRGIDTSAPSNSYMLMKATGTVSHGGGSILSTTSTDYITIRDWIIEGAYKD